MVNLCEPIGGIFPACIYLWLFVISTRSGTVSFQVEKGILMSSVLAQSICYFDFSGEDWNYMNELSLTSWKAHWFSGKGCLINLCLNALIKLIINI